MISPGQLLNTPYDHAIMPDGSILRGAGGAEGADDPPLPAVLETALASHRDG